MRRISARAGYHHAMQPGAASDDFPDFTAGRRFNSILADQSRQIRSCTGKVASEHKRLFLFKAYRGSP